MANEERRQTACPACGGEVPPEWAEEFWTGETNCGACGHYNRRPDGAGSRP